MTITLGPTVEWYNKNPLLITNGLVMSIDIGNSACYPGSGTTLYDLSGNGNNMTLNGGPTYGSSNGGYINFSGGQSMSIASLTGFATGNTPHTVDSFFYVNSLPGYRSWIVLLGQNGTGAVHWLYQNYNSYPPTNIGIYNTNNIVPEPSIPLMSWAHFVTTFDGTTFTAYLNGINVGSITVACNFTETSFVMGQPFDDYFDGKISNVRIYNRALQGYEILSNFNYFRGRFGL